MRYTRNFGKRYIDFGIKISNKKKPYPQSRPIKKVDARIIIGSELMMILAEGVLRREVNFHPKDSGGNLCPA